MRLLGLLKSRAFISCAAVLACAVGLAGCDDHVTVDRDPSVRIQRGMTWAWRPAPQEMRETRNEGGRKVISRDVIPQRSAAGPQRAFPAYADPQKDMVHVRTRIAIEQTLTSKGLTQVTDPAAADFLVDYQVGVQNRRERVAVPVDYPVLVCGYRGCWQSWGYWGPTGYAVRTVGYRQGTIVFDLVRRGDERMAFRSVYEKLLDWNSLDQEHINGGVKKMLRDLKPAN